MRIPSRASGCCRALAACGERLSAFGRSDAVLPARRARLESALAALRDGLPSADALRRLRRHDHPLRLRHGGARQRAAEHKLDPRHAPLDVSGVVVPEHGLDLGRALGVRRAGLGRLLGLGSGRECGAPAVADRDRVPAQHHDSRAARHVEDVEPVPDHLHLPAGDSGHLQHAQRHRGERPQLRAQPDRAADADFSWAFARSVALGCGRGAGVGASWRPIVAWRACSAARACSS